MIWGAVRRLRDLVEAYIAYKRSLGMSFVSDAAVLRSFCRAIEDINVEAVKPELILAFIAANRALTTRWGLKFYILRGFYRYTLLLLLPFLSKARTKGSIA